MTVQENARRTSRVVGLAALVFAGAGPAPAGAQQAAPAAQAASALAFDGVTVVDVERGKLVPGQRVVIVGNRIQAVGAVGAVKIPKGTRTVKAQGKYLVPGFWDMHYHPEGGARVPRHHTLLLANGVTGFRDAGTEIPIDTLRMWRREILAGTRVGPPRQILNGSTIYPSDSCGLINAMAEASAPYVRGICVEHGDSATARRVVEARKAAGVEMLKIYTPSWELYAAARRAGLPFGGHNDGSAMETSDSGPTILDHSLVLGEPCAPTSGTVEKCREVAERFRRNGTWWVPTCVGVVVCGGKRTWGVDDRFRELVTKFLKDSVLNPYAPRPDGHNAFYGAMPSPASAADSTPMVMRLAQEVGVPILTGTDVGPAADPPTDVPGFALHAEFALDVAEGLSPLTVLQAATLNPAKMLHATDSLGTVAPGKLADLVLLDADPLADITNTTMIRAVVANGRYFDRAALDRLLAEFQAEAKAEATP